MKTSNHSVAVATLKNTPQSLNMKSLQHKRYIIRKYVMAKSAQEAMRVEKNVKADEVFVDTDYVPEQKEVGFKNGK